MIKAVKATRDNDLYPVKKLCLSNSLHSNRGLKTSEKNLPENRAISPTSTKKLFSIPAFIDFKYGAKIALYPIILNDSNHVES